MRALLRAVATSTALIVVYYTLPFDGHLGGSDVVLLPLGLFGFSVLTGYEMRSIVQSPTPRARAVEVLATVVPLFVILFASTYYLMSKQNAAAFSSISSRTASLYFTVTVFSSVGFGDIVPVSDPARVVVMVQMISDLVLIGAGVRVLTGAVRLGVERHERATGRDAKPAPTEQAQVDPTLDDPPRDPHR